MEVTFEPTGLGNIIFRDRYARNPEETWDEACHRVAEHIAQAETNGKFKKYSDRFYEQLVTNKFNPGGRIWYGAGRPKAQLLNCFVIPTHDSREGWGRTTSDVIVISGLMGGVGINMSPIRPRGSLVKGTGGIATGAVSLMELINGVGDVIVGGGSRRMALMLALNINHPDLEEFLSKKLDREELNNANVSVIIPPDMDAEEFVSLVTENKEFELVFNGIPSGKTINARELWDKLVANAWESGEPGVLNGSFANKMNNIYYHKPLICTNPCVTGDTWVMTAGGPRRAVDLVGVETAIQTDGKFYSTKGFFKTGHKDVFTLNTREGYSVNLTPDHRVLLEDNHWVEAQDLRPGDKIVLNNHERAPSWQGYGVGEGFGSAYEGYLGGSFLR
jgi:ribonucleoside-diphosphate reductase alpha chain